MEYYLAVNRNPIASFSSLDKSPRNYVKYRRLIPEEHVLPCLPFLIFLNPDSRLVVAMVLGIRCMKWGVGWNRKGNS